MSVSLWRWKRPKRGTESLDLISRSIRSGRSMRGINYIGDIVPADLKNIVRSGRLKATGDYSFISEADCVAICVPTPLDEHFQPDISYIANSSKEIAKYLHKGMLVVLESTTYPGTTEEVVKPILESTGLECGRDFYLAFSPERVDPGNKIYKTKNTPKVVGGVTPDCTEVAAALYNNVLDSEVFRASSPKVAEMEKILENTFRNVNIALVNEMAIICEKNGYRHMGGNRSCKDQALRLYGFLSGTGSRRPLYSSRSVLPDMESPGVRLPYEADRDSR